MLNAGQAVYAPVPKFASCGTRVAYDPDTGARYAVMAQTKVGENYHVGKVIRRPGGHMCDQLGRYMVAIQTPRGQPHIVLAREDEMALAVDGNKRVQEMLEIEAAAA